jgi:pyruvate dehydrogenase E1 component alpha subunit
MHLFAATRRFYGGYAIVGGGLPIAVGLALAGAARRGGVVEVSGEW